MPDQKQQLKGTVTNALTISELMTLLSKYIGFSLLFKATW